MLGTSFFLNTTLQTHHLFRSHVAGRMVVLSGLTEKLLSLAHHASTPMHIFIYFLLVKCPKGLP